MDARHLALHVIRPTLKKLDPLIPYSLEAEQLILGTAAQESGLKWLRQLGSGPALGLYQIEPATFQDLWDSYVTYRPPLADLIGSLAVDHEDESELIWNLQYATAICRCIYYRKKGVIPTDLQGQSTFWKVNYNSTFGKGTTQEYLASHYRLWKDVYEFVQNSGSASGG